MPPNDRARLESLCRSSLLRSPLAENWLRLRTDGWLTVQFNRPWRDGTTHLVFEPLKFVGKLAALPPRPEINLLIYPGVLAPHARWRPPAVRYGRPRPTATARDPRKPIESRGHAAELALGRPHAASIRAGRGGGPSLRGAGAPARRRGGPVVVRQILAVQCLGRLARPWAAPVTGVLRSRPPTYPNLGLLVVPMAMGSIIGAFLGELLVAVTMAAIVRALLGLVLVASALRMFTP